MDHQRNRSESFNSQGNDNDKQTSEYFLRQDTIAEVEDTILTTVESEEWYQVSTSETPS